MTGDGFTLLHACEQGQGHADSLRARAQPASKADGNDTAPPPKLQTVKKTRPKTVREPLSVGGPGLRMPGLTPAQLKVRCACADAGRGAFHLGADRRTSMWRGLRCLNKCSNCLQPAVSKACRRTKERG